MSKKNSSVNLRNGFKNLRDLSKIFINFKNKIDNLDITNFLSTFVKDKKNKILVKKIRASWYEIDNQKDLMIAKKNFEK